jgi:hypothetical protein
MPQVNGFKGLVETESKPMNKHTTARKGKRIHIILNTGEEYIDKLVDRKSKYYLFELRGKVYVDTIRSFSIFKPRS